MNDNEIVGAIKEIISHINTAIAEKREFVSFDFTGSTPILASRTIQTALTESGFVTFISFDSSGSERLYVELRRSFRKKEPRGS